MLFIVAVSRKKKFQIIADESDQCRETYAKLLFEVCAYMYLKYVHVSEKQEKKSIFDNEIYNNTSFIV